MTYCDRVDRTAVAVGQYVRFRAEGFGPDVLQLQTMLSSRATAATSISPTSTP